MQPLVDGDVILYELGFAAETAWKGMKKETDPEYEGPFIPPWELVEEMLEGRIGNICGTVAVETGFTIDEPIFFFTGKTNFRNEIARRSKYKERAGDKPWHYYNIKAFIKGKYEWREREGLEADDLMAIEQTSRGCSESTIICTRDKDLRQVGGWHFGWELHKQAQFGPMFVDGYGFIALSADRKSIKGYGEKFFLSQCLTGDRVDTVPGLPGTGPVEAFKTVAHTQTYAEGLEAVREAYRGLYGGVLEADEALTEQARLLYMLREEGKMWSLYD